LGPRWQRRVAALGARGGLRPDGPRGFSGGAGCGWGAGRAAAGAARGLSLGASVTSRRTVAVIGASNDRSKFGNRAVRAYRAEGWDVYPVNLAAATIEGLPAYPSILAVPVDIERATVYLRPEVTLRVLDEIARKHVR